MEKPVVSVIIPVYNGETYLKECLDSVIRQSFSHWEMICINDGPTEFWKPSPGWTTGSASFLRKIRDCP